ncbi:MAG: hypothetical protein J5589_00335 [Firmicutes bacterium]|nr:hypothetical protein [Bacillota bacterium]
MKNVKKLLALVLALAMVCSLAACTKQAEEPTEPTSQAEESQATEESKAEESQAESTEPTETEPAATLVSADDIVWSNEFNAMQLSNLTYAPMDDTGAYDIESGDYIDLYNYVKYVKGINITLDDVTEDESTGFAYITVDGQEYELGLDFLTMAMVYNNEPTATYPTADDTYAAWWRLYITRWNYLLPEVPLYSNEYYDLYNAQIKGVEEHPTNPFWNPSRALIDWTSEKEDNSIILGSSTELSGQFREPSFGKSSPAASDSDVGSLTTGLATVVNTKEGGYIWNPTVVKEHKEEVDAEGNKTFTITIYDDMKFSDGSPITAKDYVAPTVASLSPVYTEAASRESSGRTIVGWQNAYQLYTGPDSEEGTKELAGVRLIDDYTFAITISAAFLPYFYDITYASYSPQPMAAYIGDDNDILDDGNGCYITDGFYAKDGEGKYIQAEKIRTLCMDTSAENYASYPWSGAYYVESFDNSDSSAVLKLNPYFKGNYEGTKPSIETIVYKRTVDSTQLEDLKAGGVDVIAAITGGAATDDALKLADSSNGAYVYTHYSRAGYGKLGFRADYGPAQFASVRQAIALCMDRAQFAKDFTGGYGGVVDGPYYTGSWMYKAAMEQGMLLDSYATSADAAIEVLEADGWVWNADGTPYEGTGVRYKAIPAELINENDKNYQSMDGTYKTVEVNGVYLMPLVINWFGTTENTFTDLLQTGFRENENIAKAGFAVYNQLGDFAPMLDELYQMAVYGFYAGSPMYCAFNFATGFGSAIYDYSFNMTIDPAMYDDYSAYYIRDYADIVMLND